MSSQRSLALNILTGIRGALGVVALLAPRTGARMFRIEADGSAIVMGRLFGIRNIALAVGLLRRELTAVRRVSGPFLLVNTLIDLADAGVFVAGGLRAQIGRPAATLGTALALTGAALSAAGFVSLPAAGGDR
jgi:hypothetical protein